MTADTLGGAAGVVAHDCLGDFSFGGVTSHAAAEARRGGGASRGYCKERLLRCVSVREAKNWCILNGIRWCSFFSFSFLREGKRRSVDIILKCSFFLLLLDASI